MAKSAAQSLYPHLPTAEREPVQQRRGSVGDALWPSLSRAAKAREADQRLWDRIRKRDQDHLLKCLREANGKGGR